MGVMLSFSHPCPTPPLSRAERFAFTPIPGPFPIQGEGSGV